MRRHSIGIQIKSVPHFQLFWTKLMDLIELTQTTALYHIHKSLIHCLKNSTECSGITITFNRKVARDKEHGFE